MTRKPPPSAVPQSRLGRLARIGFAAGELAVGGAIEGLRRLGQPPALIQFCHPQVKSSSQLSSLKIILKQRIQGLSA